MMPPIYARRVGDEDREILIRLYHQSGYTCPEIQGFLLLNHGYPISLRHLNRLLSSMGLRRYGTQSAPIEIVMAVQEELESCSQNLGYRMMRRRLAEDHMLTASCETIRLVLRELDPEGVDLRRSHRLRRRLYMNDRPNYAIHIDGWDKLKPYGVSVHGAMDGFSRRILWLKASESNKNPAYIAKYYLQYIREINGVPRLVCADAGTENCLVRDIQRSLRANHDDDISDMASFRYTSSVHNVRIERFCGCLKQASGLFWMNLFKDMAAVGVLDLSDPVHIECVRFVFLPLIQEKLDKVTRDWNSHTVRSSSYSDNPVGKPDVLFYQPETFGTTDYKHSVDFDLDVVTTVTGAKSTPELGCNDEFAEACLTVMLENGYTMPTNLVEALPLFGQLTDKFRQ